MIPGFVPMTMGAGLAEGAASSDFPLAAGNSDPHGLAYVHRSGGRLYVGDADEHVYCYDTGGRRLATYVMANPLPVAGAKTVRGAIVSLTQVGDYLAVVYGRLEGGEDECSIAWRPIRADGRLGNESSSTALATITATPTLALGAVAPVTVDWAAGRTYFCVGRSRRLRGYIYTNSPQTEIAGAEDASWPYFTDGGYDGIVGRAPWKGTFKCAYQCSGNTADMHAFVDPAVGGAGLILGAAINPAVTNQIIRHKSNGAEDQRLLVSIVTEAEKRTVRGMASHPDSDRIFMVLSTGRLKTYTA